MICTNNNLRLCNKIFKKKKIPTISLSVTAYTATQICLHHVTQVLTLLAMLDTLAVRAVITLQHTPGPGLGLAGAR